MTDQPPPLDWDTIPPSDFSDAPPPDWDSQLPDFSDEPPPEWDAPGLDELGILDLPPPDPVADLAVELDDVERRIEAYSIEMNTPDGSRRMDDLLEEREALREELFAPQLVDARFLGRQDLDADGQVMGYTIQCVELTQDSSGRESGRVLDVGHYPDVERAEFTYQTLQESIVSGELPIDAVAEMGEALAQENGLPAADWRDLTPEDRARYDWHVRELDNANRDVPLPERAADPVFAGNVFSAALGDPAEAAREQARLETEQARAAMRAIGLEAPDTFNLTRDAFFDFETGDRLINGVFQRDLDDPTRDCRPVLVALSTNADRIGLKAAALEYGDVGSFGQACASRDAVQQVLETDGPAQAIQAIEAQLQPSLAIETAPAWSRDID